MATVRQIIRYVHGTALRGLSYPAGTSLDLAAYSDADYAGCSDTRRSTTGWCMFLGPALISWKARNRTVCQSPRLSLNIGPCPKLVLRYFGSEGY